MEQVKIIRERKKTIETGTPRYAMHKYWGKKPAAGISPLIERFTVPGDTILDPFSGYGVFCCEAYLQNRNVIVNDLNPIANFISHNLFSKDINLQTVKTAWNKIKEDFTSYVKHWYEITIDDRVYMPISILRSKQGKPLQFSFKNGSKTVSKAIPDDIASTICDKERNYVIEDWYPQVRIIKNSRISVRSEMTIQDLFTTRTLACHARLLSLIEKYSEGAEKDLLLMAFTANLANCSKLVPPIKSRGNLAQGAWMTGFYVGDTYIENNVMHYYENRLRKAIRGKENFLELINGDLLTNQNSTYYRITNFDAKNLRIPDNSIDYVFTDPPYGDSVPYFEQSIIWNSWLKLMPDYNNEIVISDSQERSKTKEAFEVDINQAFSEIHRVLKCDKYFSLTFHSLSGLEWKAVTNACIKNNFEIVDWNWLEQKTLPPRQLNRLKTIKGDVLVTFIKKSKPAKILSYEKKDFIHIINELITSCIKNGVSDTNGIMMALMEWILRKKVIVSDTDVFEVLNDNFLLGNDGKWTCKIC